MPKVIQEYDSYLGSVDLLDKQTSFYVIRIRWCLLFTLMLGAEVVSTWKAHKTANKGDRVSLSDVQRNTVVAYLNRKSELTSKYSKQLVAEPVLV